MKRKVEEKTTEELKREERHVRGRQSSRGEVRRRQTREEERKGEVRR